MTTPATGAPDWQTYTSWHGAPIFDQAVNLNANQLSTLQQVDSSSYQGMHLSVTSNLNGGQITVLSSDTFSNVQDDIAGQWIMRPDTRLEVTVPLPRTVVAVTAQAEAANPWLFNIRFALTNVACDKHHYYGTGSMLAGNNVAIGAGVLNRHFPTTLLPGPAHLWLFNNVVANNLKVRIQRRNMDGTQGDLIYENVSAVAEFNADFLIPTQLYELDVFNLGAGATQYYFALTTQGMMA